MNERMTELYAKACLDARDKHFEDKDVSAFIACMAENFAELIVRDCVNTIEGIEPGYKDYRDQIEDAFRRDCVAEIKHKFGVDND